MEHHQMAAAVALTLEMVLSQVAAALLIMEADLVAAMKADLGAITKNLAA
ncbi:hypothetical protein G3563_29885, partial [Escherichia coli]|nr:hypothetical protein [Escherichia coli]